LSSLSTIRLNISVGIVLLFWIKVCEDLIVDLKTLLEFVSLINKIPFKLNAKPWGLFKPELIKFVTTPVFEIFTIELLEVWEQ